MHKYLFPGVSLLLLADTVLAQDVEMPDLREDPACNEEPVAVGPGHPIRCGRQDASIGFHAPTDEDRITVTATGTRIEVEDTGQQVTVIGEHEILSVQGPDLARVLERVPGLTLTRNGGLGSFTGARLRGAEAEQLLVVVDGVRVADPAAPSGGFDFGTLTSNNLAKIEVLRGSNSTIWGSDAVGGVMVVSTRATSDVLAQAEYGADDTFSSAVSGGVSGEDGFLGGSASYVTSAGFSSAADGTEPDGFEQWALEGHGRYYFSDRFELYARLRHAESELDIDGFAAPAFTLGDTLDVQDTRQTFASVGAIYDTGPLFLQASYSLADTSRDNHDGTGATSFASDGRSDRLSLRGEWRPIGPLLVNFGAENEWTSYETLFDPGASTRILGTYAQAGIEWRGISGHVGARFDDHADFGSEVSFGADASYQIAPGWRVRASVGEGFKAPTLFQLLSDFGNPLLEPEHATSFDIGIAYGDRTRTLYGALTLFRRDTEDQIAFVSCFGNTSGICSDRPFGTYDNIDRTRAQGMEAELRVRPTGNVQLSAVYALTNAEDRGTGLDLARRPRHAATLGADWMLAAALSLGADLRIVSDSFDDAGNFVRLAGYEVLTVRAAYDISDAVALYGRIENPWNEDYQTAAGYATRGRAAFVGARVKL